ncbi:MAG: Gfo/Idh/MocA family protein, partial [Mycobacteriales bacterium]
YAVSAALWAVRSPVTGVRAEMMTGPTGVDLTAALQVAFAGGATATLRCSFALPERQWLRIVGREGVAELEDPSFTSYQRGCALALATGAGATREAFPAEDAYRVMVEEVSRAVAGEGGWVLPVAQSLAGARVLDAARESAAGGGRWVSVPEP